MQREAVTGVAWIVTMEPDEFGIPFKPILLYDAKAADGWRAIGNATVEALVPASALRASEERERQMGERIADLEEWVAAQLAYEAARAADREAVEAAWEADNGDGPEEAAAEAARRALNAATERRRLARLALSSTTQGAQGERGGSGCIGKYAFVERAADRDLYRCESCGDTKALPVEREEGATHG